MFVAAAVAALYLSMSCVAFAAVGRDKAAASAHLHRISENNLHLLSLAGGWPGALLAYHLFRHKTRKKSFQFEFRTTVVINSMLLFSGACYLFV